ncbi:hypothetical protein TRFO_37658 [Tritrichomonas foetus]|uniref:Protein kinase domain-containing protein n=1 Tax=Tritrichomonas foetus TaxID=1144522 RepID=A0A1J4JG96_9EUKA|nr:hypothetical protein TRFO_37658 [Tritrichomonas foetus]|eukprot:OHS96220.1 hypothetical protein TRFO_37658 [Tritrichomonas foetus]
MSLGDIAYDSFIIDKNQYKYNKTSDKIGSGRFGTMYCATKVGESDDVKYAIRISENDASSQDTNKQFLREIELYIKIRSHPAICKFFGWALIPQTIVLEYLPNGSLKSIFDNLAAKKSVPEWTPTLKSKTIFGIAAAMMHLHNHEAFHRYLTPSSILFDAKYEPRLNDFSHSKMDLSNATNMTIMKQDTPYYTAPELFESDDYDHRVDNFAFGMIMFQIITGRPPYEGGPLQVMRSIKNNIRPKIPDDCCPKLAHMLTDLWDENPTERPEFVDIVKCLNDYDEPLFPGTDMDQYIQYRTTIMKSTFMTDADEEFFKSPKINDDDVGPYKAAKAGAKAGDPSQMIKVARMKEKGVGTLRDVEQAFEWYCKAADHGNAEAMYKVANFYSLGIENGIKNDEKYLEYLQKASDKNYPPAIVDYAFLLLQGYGVAQDIEKAQELFTKMANPPYSDPEAQYRLAQILETTDPKEAVKFYDMAIKAGLMGANVDYALMLLNGIGIPKNEPEGIRILTQAADKGFPMANYNLGRIYESHLYNQSTDSEKSLKYYKAAADAELALGLVKYGKALFRGRHADADCQKDPEYAARCFEKAAKLGDPEGLHSWGTFLHKGFGGTPINIAEAIKCYQLAAEAGFVPSMVRLYEIYYQGICGTRNLELSKYYCQMAADHGNEPARAFLAESFT